jgi:hypothetical protein
LHQLCGYRHSRHVVSSSSSDVGAAGCVHLPTHAAVCYRLWVLAQQQQQQQQ